MQNIQKMRNARKVVQLLGAVEPNTQVLIIYDPKTEHNVEPLAIAVEEAGGALNAMMVLPGGGHGADLSPVVAAAMRAADLVIGITQNNITHAKARKEAQAVGTHVIALPESDGDEFFLAPGWDCDFVALRPEIERLAAAFTQAREARVFSALGTDITIGLEGRMGRALTGFANADDVSAGYGLEASIAPVEGTANGTIVVNASIPGVSVISDEVVRITVENGLATSIEGGRAADTFRALLESFQDPLVYNLGELGVGMNPSCQIDGTMLSDEAVYGAIQLALGTSASIGGTVQAAAHYDTIVTDATLELDGRIVLDGNELRI